MRDVSMDDRYSPTRSTALLSGTQAIVRMLISQRELDRRAGLSTAGYVSGYRGSPLGGLDFAFWKASKHLGEADITFEPGVNEDLAATAVWGTQQLESVGKSKVDGVFALWYGKGPGVDRSGDAIKHGNYAGTHRNGGVLVLFGDDHPGKSSTVAHHSEPAIAAHSVPILYPADVEDTIRLGLFGFSMSRYSGSWVGMKMVNETAEQTSVIDLDLARIDIVKPDVQDLVPPEGVHYRGTFSPLRDESIVLHHRLPLVKRFAAANRIDRLAFGGPGAFGIVTAGKAFQDVMQALSYLRIDAARCKELGIGVFKVGMVWPLEETALSQFSAGRKELLFVEEKSAFMETQAAAILYNVADRPRIIGKFDGDRRPLVSQEQSLEPLEIAQVIARRLEENGLADEALRDALRTLNSFRSSVLSISADSAVRRVPYFCSGCPHSTSTRVPEDGVAFAGIGCHGMAMWASPRTLTSTQMGGEGANWIGLHRFTEVPHVYQNMGDGTYFHSGLLAIRAAVTSGANITYKILFNDAVAMTGGQPVDGHLSVRGVVHQLIDENVRRVVVVTDNPSGYRGGNLPPGVDVVHRDELDRVQRALREMGGCTVLIYEQTCAAEKRRRKKRDKAASEKRLFINESVCEGCGDCSTQSGCISIEPKDTVLGRKRAINQSTCNLDYSCVKGFCPSFVSVSGASRKKSRSVTLEELEGFDIPAPRTEELPGANFGIMIAGIGGTGVITVGAILTAAAHWEGKAASSYDMTGLSQKNGAVYSHVRIAESSCGLAAPRLGLGDASLVLAFDMVAGIGDECWRTIMPGRTRFVGNDRVQPTAAGIRNRDENIEVSLLQRKIDNRLSHGQGRYIDATGIATALCGDQIASNLFLVGAAAQLDWLPVSAESIAKAIRLNGVQVEMNMTAFILGRLYVHDPKKIAELLGKQGTIAPRLERESFDEILRSRSTLLTAYQSSAYAERYASLVERVSGTEERVLPGSRKLASAVARSLAKLMAYKDEYEVARLYASPDFRSALESEFEGNIRLRFHLAPPIFSSLDRRTGQPKKYEFGGWMLGFMHVLSRLRVLRGGVFDIFGYTAERRSERQLVKEYENIVVTICESLTAANHDVALAIAEVPDSIRGYGHVKERAMRDARETWDGLLRDFSSRSGALEVAIGQ